VVSITNISSGQASTYYQKDNYYTSQQGQWHGKGAENLGLTGEIKHEDFIAVVNGKAPDGSFEIAKGGESQEHRAGVDLTFSAPKSASILAELDPRIADAHDKAVKATLDWIEKNYAMARQTIDGETQRVQTQNLVVATFQHETSRELDPQLHAHCLVANMTQREDGQWRALSNEEIYKAKMTIGQHYRNELAANLRELGYGVQSDSKGLFEIAGVDQKVIDHFSRRSEQIAEKVNELRQQFPGAGESKLREMACLDSRESKKDVDMNMVRESWDKRLHELGYAKEQILAQAQAAGKEQVMSERTAYIRDSARIMTEQESTFSRDELLKTAGKLSMGNARFAELETAFNDLVKNKEIIQLDHDIYTTKEMQHIERDIVNMVQQGKGTMQSISDRESIQVGIARYETDKGFQMTAGQRQAAEHILSSKDAIIGVQGDAGTGKTTVLDFVRSEAERAGYDVRGFSFTGKAAEEVTKASGIKSQTIDSFLAQRQEQGMHETGNQKQIWIVDEASMLGSRKMHEFLTWAQEENARVVLVGDVKQLQSVEAGKMFAKLQEHGMETVRMREVQRQKDESYKDIVTSISEKKIDRAVEKMEKQERLHEISDRQERFQAIKDEYMKDPNRTVVVTSLNRDRNELNQMIRSDLKSQGKLLGQDYTFVVRGSKGLQPVEKHFSQNYEAGDIVVANKAGIFGRAGAEARVKDVDQHNHTIQVETWTKKEGMKTYTVDLKTHGQDLQVYSEKEIRLTEGDRVVFMKNDRGLGVKNGQTGIVNEITPDGKVTVSMGKETKTFSIRNQYNYIDYGYAVTTYKSQGQTTDKVIYHADTRTVNYNEAYVAMTRGRYDMKIYTNSKSDFVEGMKQEQAKTSTLDYRTNQTQTEQAKQTKSIAGQTRQPETRQPEKTRQTEAIHLNSYISKFSSEPAKRGWLDKVQLLQGNRNRGKWSVNYERRHGLVYEKRTRSKWTGKTVIEKSNRSYKSRTEIKKSFIPWEYKSTTISFDKKTGKLTMTKQDLTRSWFSGKLKANGPSQVTQIDTRKIKSEIRDKTILRAIERAEKTLKAKDFEKVIKAIEEYQKYQTRQAVLVAALTQGSVEIRYGQGHDKTEEQGQGKEAVLGSRGR
jgi:conjugative relaxase-like TrwC/TraI family protein